MLVIRLSRQGAKKVPFYHVVAIDSRKARDARCLERLGYFNPVSKGQEQRLTLNVDKINEWVAKGAQLSDRVASLLKEHAKQPAQPEASAAVAGE